MRVMGNTRTCISVFLVAAACFLGDSGSRAQTPDVQKGTGIIKACTYAWGDSCGPCYSLEPLLPDVLIYRGRKIQGAAVLDCSEVGDISAYLSKIVRYEGTTEFEKTFVCPRHFKLLSIEMFREPVENVPLQKGKGIIHSCQHGLSACGPCYSLEPIEGSSLTFNDRPLKGWAVLDCSQVEDVGALVGKTVFYEGTADFKKNMLCPMHFQLRSVVPASTGE